MAEDRVVNAFDEDLPVAVIEDFRLLLGSEASAHMSNHDCLRFLRARNGSFGKAVAMALEWHEWKHTIGAPLPPRGLAFSPNILVTCPDRLNAHPHVDLLLACHHGFDKEGSPIYWERTGLIQAHMHLVNEHFTVDELLQYHIMSQEVCELRLEHASEIYGKPIHKAVTVFDLKGLTMTLDSQSISYVRQMLYVDQAYYPERLKRLIVINAPWYFNAIYAIFSAFVDKRTAEKFIIVGSNYMETLLQYIDIDDIPPEMGGQAQNIRWGGPFDESSGASDEQITQRMFQRVGNGKLEKLLRPDEIAVVKQAVKISIEKGHIDPKDVTIDLA